MNYPLIHLLHIHFSIAKKIQSHFQLPQIRMGPGQYHPRTEKKGGTLNFGSYSWLKMVLAQEALTPGPLHYTINTYRSYGFSFANSKKPLNKLSLSPGPGQYLPIDESHYGLGGSISRISRKDNFDNKIPGAGHYPIKSTLNNLGFKFIQLHKRAYTDHMSPGPGSYSILQDSMNHGVKMHNSKRSCSYIQKTELQVLELIKGKVSLKTECYQNIQKFTLRSYQKSQINVSLNMNQSNHQINLQHTVNQKGPLILMRSYEQDQNSSLIGQQLNISDSYNKMREYGKLKQEKRNLRRISTPNPRKISRSPGPAIYSDIKFQPNTKLRFMPASQKSETFNPKEGPGVGEQSKILPFVKIYNKHITPKRQIFQFKDLNQFDFDEWLLFLY